VAGTPLAAETNSTNMLFRDWRRFAASSFKAVYRYGGSRTVVMAEFLIPSFL
jgi:hypothetical protein